MSRCCAGWLYRWRPAGVRPIVVPGSVPVVCWQRAVQEAASVAVFRCVPFDVLVGFVVALVSWSVSWCIGAVPGSTSAPIHSGCCSAVLRCFALCLGRRHGVVPMAELFRCLVSRPCPSGVLGPMASQAVCWCPKHVPFIVWLSSPWPSKDVFS